jgi:hypothetical protein
MLQMGATGIEEEEEDFQTGLALCFRPRVHRRQIVERQFCRLDVFNGFEWTCRVVACVHTGNQTY